MEEVLRIVVSPQNRESSVYDDYTPWVMYEVVKCVNGKPESVFPYIRRGYERPTGYRRFNLTKATDWKEADWKVEAVNHRGEKVEELWLKVSEDGRG